LAHDRQLASFCLNNDEPSRSIKTEKHSSNYIFRRLSEIILTKKFDFFNYQRQRNRICIKTNFTRFSVLRQWKFRIKFSFGQTICRKEKNSSLNANGTCGFDSMQSNSGEIEELPKHFYVLAYRNMSLPTHQPPTPSRQVTDVGNEWNVT